MTFNRYIAFRMVMELIGTAACAVQPLLHDHTAIGLAATAVAALVWAGGELWVVMIFNRERPRSDELSDRHQLLAVRFAFHVTVIALLILGFASMIGGLLFRTYVMITPMALPAPAMLALALADARYLWLERRDAVGVEYDDED